MKLKIDKRWQWLAVDDNGDQWLFEDQPTRYGQCWTGDESEYANVFTDLEPGALYRRTGEDEWEKVQ